MVGIKGKSGRKKNDSGWTARAVALYIPSFKTGKKKHGKDEWRTVPWFRMFKKIYGSRSTSNSPYNWQEKIRIMIRQEVNRYTTQNGWFCECSGILNRWHFRHDPSCHKCGYEPRDLERHRTVAQVRANTIESKTPKEPLILCPNHNKPLQANFEEVAGVVSKVMRCEDCKQ